MEAANGDKDALPSPWLCHTFSSKAMGFLVDSFMDGRIGADEDILFWCTKTLVQPADCVDVFERASVAPGVRSYMHACGVSDTKTFFDQPHTKRL